MPRRKALAEAACLAALRINRGDIMGVRGFVGKSNKGFLTKREKRKWPGELSIFPKAVKLLATCLHMPLHLQFRRGFRTCEAAQRSSGPERSRGALPQALLRPHAQRGRAADLLHPLQNRHSPLYILSI